MNNSTYYRPQRAVLPLMLLAASHLLTWTPGLLGEELSPDPSGSAGVSSANPPSGKNKPVDSPNPGGAATAATEHTPELVTGASGKFKGNHHVAKCPSQFSSKVVNVSLSTVAPAEIRAARARGRYLTVTLAVTNESPHGKPLCDLYSGTLIKTNFRLLSGGQTVPNQFPIYKWPSTIEIGATANIQLVFAVPNDAKDLALVGHFDEDVLANWTLPAPSASDALAKDQTQPPTTAADPSPAQPADNRESLSKPAQDATPGGQVPTNIVGDWTCRVIDTAKRDDGTRKVFSADGAYEFKDPKVHATGTYRVTGTHLELKAEKTLLNGEDISRLGTLQPTISAYTGDSMVLTTKYSVEKCTKSGTAAEAAAATDPQLQGLSASEVLKRAYATAVGAESLRVRADSSSSGGAKELSKYDIVFSGLSTATGTFHLDASSATVIHLFTNLYTKGGPEFYAEVFGPARRAQAGAIGGRYLRVPADDPDFKGFTAMLMQRLFLNVALQCKGTLSRVPGKPIGGSPTIGIKCDDNKEPRTIYIADAWKYFPLLIETDPEVAKRTRIEFSDWNKKVEITEPAADQVINISDLPHS